MTVPGYFTRTANQRLGHFGCVSSIIGRDFGRSLWASHHGIRTCTGRPIRRAYRTVDQVCSISIAGAATRMEGSRTMSLLRSSEGFGAPSFHPEGDGPYV